MQIEWDHEDAFQAKARKLYEALNDGQAASLSDLQRQMAKIKAMEKKLAELEWEIERSSYLIQEEPDLEDLVP